MRCDEESKDGVAGDASSPTVGLRADGGAAEYFAAIVVGESDCTRGLRTDELSGAEAGVGCFGVAALIGAGAGVAGAAPSASSAGGIFIARYLLG